MPASEQWSDTARFTVRNIGGIRQTDVEIPPGVTVLTGKNATNRTSFLQSIRAALGSTGASLKGDADAGAVTVQLAGETYERRLERTEDGVRFTGDSYLDEPSVADLFAFLLETNDARRSVAGGEDLREQILRPVDTAAIESEIERLEREKATVREEITAIESRKRDLPELERRRRTLREEVATKRSELAEKEAQIDEVDVERHRQDQTELEETLETLRETRSELESVRRDIQSQSESLASLKSERAELAAELEELADAPADEPDELESEVATLRERRQSLNAELSELQSLIQYNQDRLDDDETGQLLNDGSVSTEAVTDRLVAEDPDTVVCWTCGSTVDREEIATTVERLRDLREERLATLETVKSELEAAKTAKSKIEQRRHRRTELESKLDEIETERERRAEQVASLKTRRGELTEAVESLEETVESLEAAEFESVLSLHREANQLEFEIDGLESEIEDVSAEIESIEDELSKAAELRERRDRLAEALTEKRTEIDRIEATAVEAFNEHMDAILDSLGYDNLERIWIERVEETVREGRRTVDRTTFELHIVRTTENGAAYEDTVDHLSESEREVTGLVFALAGYLVHDLHETVPFMLLDSLEAIDSGRIASLVDYLSDYVAYLVVALLPEDATALDDSYTRVRSL